MTDTITMSEWMSELSRIEAESGKEDYEYLTTTDIQSITGYTRQRILKYLHAADAAGLLDSKRVMRVGLGGSTHTHLGYRLLPKKGKK